MRINPSFLSFLSMLNQTILIVQNFPLSTIELRTFRNKT